CLQDTQLPPIF
nr:immunoglobulin light chain junction region [Macaca mulatta]MOX53324.1 immunoglobulin light chain junction region [Macaca mulatta]